MYGFMFWTQQVIERVIVFRSKNFQHDKDTTRNTNCHPYDIWYNIFFVKKLVRNDMASFAINKSIIPIAYSLLS